MTAIAGLIDKKNKKTYLASDSMGSNEFTGHNYKTKKVFKNKILTIGGCGSYRAIQILQYKFSPRPFQIEESVKDYVYKYLDEELRKILKEHKYLSIDKDQETMDEAGFIIAIKDRLFMLQTDISLLEPNHIFCAEGSGTYHVESSIYTQLQLAPEKPYKEILQNAIEYTSQVVLSVGGKVNILEHSHG